MSHIELTTEKNCGIFYDAELSRILAVQKYLHGFSYVFLKYVECFPLRNYRHAYTFRNVVLVRLVYMK